METLKTIRDFFQNEILDVFTAICVIGIIITGFFQFNSINTDIKRRHKHGDQNFRRE